MLSIDQITEKLSCICRKVEILRNQNRVESPVADLYAVPKNVGVVIISTASADTRNVMLPDPALNKNRRITVVNYSGASQSVFSHDGAEETIRPTSSAVLVSNLVIANSAASTTAGSRFTFLSTGAAWIIVNN